MPNFRHDLTLICLVWPTSNGIAFCIVHGKGLEVYGEFNEHENIHYERSFRFETVSIGTNSGNEIIYIRTNDPCLKTTNRLRVGDLKQDISERYGDNYYEKIEMGKGDSINYIDRQFNIQLQFWLIEDRITEIVLKKVR